MLTRPAQSTTVRRPVAGAVRFLLVVVGIVGASVGVAVWSTDPDRSAGPGAVAPRRAARGVGEVKARSSTAQPQIPRYSEDWTDDSGVGLAARFSRPITDPQSLEQVRTSDEGRGRQRDRSTAGGAGRDRSPGPRPAGRRRSSSASSSGLLHMSVGEFTEADRCFAEAQVSRSRLSQLAQSEHRGPARGRRPAARRGRELHRLLQRVELHLPARPRGGAPSALRIARGDPPLHHLPRAAARGPGRPLAVERRPHDAGRLPRRGTEPVPHPARAVPVATEASAGSSNVAGRVGLTRAGANMSGGIIVDDFNGDGLLDVFYSTSDPTEGRALFVNRGDGTFEDRSDAAGLSRRSGP